ncbi:conjugative transposon protein TraN [Flavobacterium aquiphilum]|uniref:conjugative transposon protein TraN n=1 Tax=Flavobacterium aquiphilum TaxID=3003261 RepID=UPI00247FB9A3|nr:conjugative transposon protein TraN [Flavobacterium aquiphilum]
MKNSNWLMMVMLVLTALSGYSQYNIEKKMLLREQFENLQIGYSKTTSIIFPYPIKSVDRGSYNVLIQKAKGVENVLLLKAGQKNFIQTNLTVVTTDGKLYVFVLNYNEECPDLNFKVDNSIGLNNEILFSLENENQKTIEQYADLALYKTKKIYGLKRERFGIKLQLNGLFIHQNAIYLRLILENTSSMNYDVDQLRFFICDQKKSKRTASQEIEIFPLLTSSVISTISDQSEVTAVFALPKFTIPEKKYLTIQLIEKNGGRQVQLDIKNSDLNKVEILN